MDTDTLQEAAKFVAGYEGFRPRAYWDVDAWRVGFGSDTEGPEQVRVTRETTTNRDRALQNLALRLRRFADGLPPASMQWPRDAQIAMLDLAYNYGHLPFNIEQVVVEHPGATHLLALAIARHEFDNRGVNRHRRQGEEHEAIS